MQQETLPFTQDTSDQEILSSCQTFKDALRLALSKSGKSAQVVALLLTERGFKIDESTLSLSLAKNPSQKKNFPSEALDAFMEMTNDIPRRYLALKAGCILVRIKSEVEKELEQERALRIKAEEKVQNFIEILNKSNVSLFK